MDIKKSRQLGLAVIAIVYVAAGVLAFYVSGRLANYDLVSRIFWADLAATVFVYLVGVLLSNATVYDPYWSVAPIVIAGGLIYSLGVRGIGVWLLFTVICVWGARLTANWVYTFRDLDHQDWRVYLFIVSIDPSLWRLGFGALMNTLMFVFISIPMAERRLASQKSGYEEYAARTRLLIPIRKST